MDKDSGSAEEGGLTSDDDLMDDRFRDEVREWQAHNSGNRLPPETRPEEEQEKEPEEPRGRLL